MMSAQGALRYKIWDDEPAPNSGPEPNWKAPFTVLNQQFETIPKYWSGYPYEEDWERHSYPLGNGHMGINVFGRIDQERVQLTEKTFYNTGMWGLGGITNFAELYLEFDHDPPDIYRRELDLNDGIARVYYEADGVAYIREYFVSNPDNVVVIRMSTKQGGKFNVTVRPEIPYLSSVYEVDKKSGKVLASGNLLTLSGSSDYRNLNYEAQIKVTQVGGQLHTQNHKGNASIRVEDAKSVTIVMTAGTNYELSSEVFLNADEQKLDPGKFPHDSVSQIIEKASSKGFEALKKSHLDDYRELFERVSVSWSTPNDSIPTKELLQKYKQGERDPYLEELMFHYGRYLLIASSRENSLPSGLQGAWSNYERTPWTGGYWHNINVQMNYWGAFVCDLSETFKAYLRFFEAYLPKARAIADTYVAKHNLDRLSDPGQNGWIVGTGVTPYHIQDPGGHSGPGTGGFTSKLLMEYYLFTQDKSYLERVVYPALVEMSLFYDKALKTYGENLLMIEPSASPEQQVSDLSTIQGKPGRVVEDGYYMTAGTTFDQGFVWENHNDVTVAASVLGKRGAFLEKIKKQMASLDPILIGDSGQIKEYREETFYSEIGDPNHRHISHLCGLYPGSLINSSKPAWMAAASKTLDLRGYKTTGWAMAHRMNCRARLMEGEKAHEIYQSFISEKTVENLWTLHPPFQIDGNFGVMAGVAEMLIQSHEGFIRFLPALPEEWENGEFDGLIARGNFSCSAVWNDSKISSISIESRSGGECSVSYAGISQATILTSEGEVLEFDKEGNHRIRFQTTQGTSYFISLKM